MGVTIATGVVATGVILGNDCFGEFVTLCTDSWKIEVVSWKQIGNDRQ